VRLLYAILFLIFSLFSTLSLHAQIPDGSVAPDFTVVDIEGRSHNLYNYLNQGKTVIIEVASTWCFPCWSYLQIGALSDIHQIMGPEGLDNVVILFVEAESRNTTEQLHGVQGYTGDAFADNTHGDWVSEINYPIIDDASIGELLQISSYPTIFKVCPNGKQIYDIGTGSTNQLLNTLLDENCIPTQHNNDAAILRYIGTTSICAAQENSLPIEIINLGNNEIENATISISDGNTILSSTIWSGHLATYEREKVFLDPILSEDNIDLIFNIQSNTGDADMRNNKISQFLTYATKSSGTEVNIEIYTDQYGFETYWELRSDDGTVYAKGGNEAVGTNGGGPPYINQPYGEGAYYDFDFIQRTVSLPLDGCYEFFIADDYGDGLCCSYGDGYFSVTDNHGKILIEGGKFADSATYPFSKIEAAATTATDAIDNAKNIVVYPNPAKDYLTIDLQQFESSGNYEATIYNTIGQQVIKENFTLPDHHQTISVDLISLPSGIYFLSLTNKKQQTYNTRFMVD